MGGCGHDWMMESHGVAARDKASSILFGFGAHYFPCMLVLSLVAVNTIYLMNSIHEADMSSRGTKFAL
jgi:hypothetical protein